MFYDVMWIFVVFTMMEVGWTGGNGKGLMCMCVDVLECRVCFFCVCVCVAHTLSESS